MPKPIDTSDKQTRRSSRSIAYEVILNPDGTLNRLIAKRQTHVMEGSTSLGVIGSVIEIVLQAADVPNAFKNQLSAVETAVDTADV